ncbi:MAG TPA: protein kinase [Ktedonobacteraceae bacterium]
MQPEDLLGQTLGHYTIKRQIGYGGMATVFLADDIHLGREVALKVFWPRPGETQDFLRRFIREARVLAQLDHPHILPVYDYGEEGELAFLVAPYMAGGSLKELLQKRKALPPSEAIQLISQVLPALQYAHDRNLIHRDIKPGNLLFKSDGNLLIADFGLVKVLEGDDREGVPLQTISETGQLLAGTPEYMSPEQIDGHALPASDLYSLGIVLYEMVTGTRPFSSPNLLSVLMKHANEVPRSPRELNPYVSPQLEAAIMKALEKDPARRFARPADFFQALQQTSNPLSQPGLAGSSLLGNAPNIAQARPGQQTSGQYGPTVSTGWGQDADPTAQSQFGRSASTPNAPVIANKQFPPGFNPGATSAPTVANSQPGIANPWPPAQPPAQVQRPASQPGIAQGGYPAAPFQPAPQQVNQPIQNWAPAQTIAPAFVPQQPRRSHTPLAVLLVLLVLLIGIIASLFVTPLGAKLFGQHTPATPTPGGVPVGVTGAPGSTKPLPATSTSCPDNNHARAAVMATLARGNDQTIVYIVNENDTSGNPTFGTVKIFDTANGQKRELAKAAHTSVDEAQVSNDGQWVLFSATVDGQSELRLVRLDGQGLQTLYCASAGTHIRYSQWSIDQHYIIFDVFPQNGEPTVYLLDTRSGALQVEVTPPASGYALVARTWLDNNRVLMVGIVPNGDAPQQNIYLLNLSNGARQSTHNLAPIFTSTAQPCWDFDSSYDAQSLFITQCAQNTGSNSSTISQLPINGGAAKPILNSSTTGFGTVRVIDLASAKLLAIGSGANNGQGIEGLYLINTDGSGSPFLLTSINANDGSFGLNSFSQYYWSNVSRDHTMYALATTKQHGSSTEYIISYGQLGGGTPTPFVDYNQYMAVAGWTAI